MKREVISDDRRKDIILLFEHLKENFPSKKLSEICLEIETTFYIKADTIRKIINKYLKFGVCTKEKKTGRKRKTNPRTERFIKKRVLCNPKKSRSLVCKELKEENIIEISERTLTRICNRQGVDQVIQKDNLRLNKL